MNKQLTCSYIAVLKPQTDISLVLCICTGVKVVSSPEAAALLAFLDCDVALVNSSIQGVSASAHSVSDAVLVFQNSSVTIVNSTFKDNRDAIAVYGAPEVSVDQCPFLNNSGNAVPLLHHAQVFNFCVILHSLDHSRANICTASSLELLWALPLHIIA